MCAHKAPKFPTSSADNRNTGGLCPREGIPRSAGCGLEYDGRVDRTKALKQVEEPQGSAGGVLIQLLGEVNQANAEVWHACKALRVAEERATAAEKLATIGRLAGAINHEIRNPLGAIKNAVYFLKQRLADADERVVEFLDIIDQEATGATRTVQNLLQFGRVAAPSRRAADLNSLVREAAQRTRCPPRVRIRYDFASALPTVYVDPDQMGHVFRNLADNAIQAMSEGGMLVISSSAPNRHVQVSFCDTGPGMDKATMQRIFDPLFSTKARGFGLGLTICQSVVEKHGGRIKVKSKPGAGSTFRVCIPIDRDGDRQAGERERQATRPAGAGRGPGRPGISRRPISREKQGAAT